MPILALGSQSQIVYEKEATFGTAPDGTNAKILYFSSEGFNQERPNVDSVIISGKRNVLKPVRGNVNVTGAISTELQAYIGNLYYGALGAAVVADIELECTAAPSGTFTIGEEVTGAGGAVGVFMALGTGVTAATSLVIKKVSGTFAVDELVTGTDSGATATMDAASVETAIVAAPYHHLIYVGDSIPSWTFEKRVQFSSADSTYFRYSGCKVNTMSISASPDGMQDISFDFVGANALPDYGDDTELTSSFASSPADLGKTSFDALGVGTVQISGASNSACITSLDLSLSNNLDDSLYCLGGEGERSYLPAGLGAITGTLNVLFEDTNSFGLYQKAVGFTEVSVQVGWAQGSGDGTAGNEAIDFFIPEMVLSPNSPMIDGPTGVQVGYDFQAYYQDYGASADYESGMYILLKNTQSSITT